MAGAICDIRGGSLISGSQSPLHLPPQMPQQKWTEETLKWEEKWGVLEPSRELLQIAQRVCAEAGGSGRLRVSRHNRAELTVGFELILI